MAIDIGLTLLFVLDNALGHPSGKLATLVDLDQEANLPSWYSSCQWMILALLFAAFAHVKSLGSGRPLILWLITGLCVALSLDEIAQIHEWLGFKSDALLPGGTRSGSGLHVTGIWTFLVGPPFVAMAYLVWRALLPHLKGRRRPQRLYLAGFSVFAGSALGLELLSNFDGGTGALHVVQVAAEELGEMVGVSLMVWATADLLASHGIHIGVRDVPPDEG